MSAAILGIFVSKTRLSDIAFARLSTQNEWKAKKPFSSKNTGTEATQRQLFRSVPGILSDQHRGVCGPRRAEAELKSTACRHIPGSRFTFPSLSRWALRIVSLCQLTYVSVLLWVFLWQQYSIFFNCVSVSITPVRDGEDTLLFSARAPTAQTVAYLISGIHHFSLNSAKLMIQWAPPGHTASDLEAISGDSKGKHGR